MDMEFSDEEKKVFSKMGKASVQKRFAGKTQEEISAIMAKASHARPRKGQNNIGS